MAIKLIPLKDVCQMLGGVNRSTIYRNLIGNPKFPRAVRIGRKMFWDERELEFWITTDAPRR